jgi:endonuclease YncB( thermonuclease family)
MVQVSKQPVVASHTLSIAVVLAPLAWLTWQIARGPIVVVDGDTVDRGCTRYRLLGLDAPEIRHPAPPEERARGRAAAQRLRELIRTARHVELVPAEGRRRDKYGRKLARLLVDGRDVAEIMIAEGLAQPYGEAHDE